MSKQNPTNLAGGQRRAQFSMGSNPGDEIELKNISLEPREDITPVDIDRSRPAKHIIPKGDMLLVQRREPENISAGGLIIPDEGKERPAEGVIIAAGPGVNETSDGVQVGDHIIFGKYAGTEYPWGAETLLFMREDEIIATVED